MCFGEKFPDGKALEKKLITVKVETVLWFYLWRKFCSTICSGRIQHSVSFFSSLYITSTPVSLPLPPPPVGGSFDLSTLSRVGPDGGGLVSSQRQRQPTDVAQQPLRSHPLRVRHAGGPHLPELDPKLHPHRPQTRNPSICYGTQMVHDILLLPKASLLNRYLML